MKQASAKPASAPAKPGRKPKGEESRLGAKRQKKEADLKFEECCQAVLGARVGVWWEDDNCYYKVCTAALLLPLKNEFDRRHSCPAKADVILQKSQQRRNLDKHASAPIVHNRL